MSRLSKWFNEFMKARWERAREEIDRNYTRETIPLRTFVTYYDDVSDGGKTKLMAEKVLWDAAAEHYGEVWEKIEPHYEFTHLAGNGDRSHCMFAHKNAAEFYSYLKPRAKNDRTETGN